MLSKSVKYGIKYNGCLWCTIQLHLEDTGRHSQRDQWRPRKEPGVRVVLDVTDRLKGHNVIWDNFFTSYILSQQLLRRTLTIVAAVRKNKPELPHALLATRGRETLSSQFAFTPTTTVVSYTPKKNKNMVLMSTLHKTTVVVETGSQPWSWIITTTKEAWTTWTRWLEHTAAGGWLPAGPLL